MKRKRGNFFVLLRSGGWRKVFPTETAVKYKTFFDVDRPFNRLLRDE